MIFKFTLISDEVDNFLRVIEIDSEATFLDLHNAILDSVDYEKNQMTSFFLCNDDWEKQQEITLVEMESSSEYDNLVMEETILDQILNDEKQKILYVFDMISDRTFFIELTEIIPGKDLDEPVCVKSKGKPPVQIYEDSDINLLSKDNKLSSDSDENFYGDEDFDEDELDNEGFGDLNLDDDSLFSDDFKY